MADTTEIAVYTEEQFASAVTEYRAKKKDAMKLFIHNVLELGEILSKHRESLKESGKWMKFLEDCDIHLSTANQQIAMFEYARKTSSEKILEKAVTNWSKMQLFLSLPESKKQKVLETTKDEEESTDEFRERAGAVENEDVVVSDESDALMTHLEEVIEEGSNLLTIDPSVAATAMQKELGLPSRTKPVLEAMILMAKATQLLEENLPKLTEADKTTLGAMFTEQKTAISTLSL